ncbi:MAG: hypothetical protein MUC88_25340 [Planctomycetes bacterium]|jgi:hypothetical protein|nr:hypothetical protein [Planctomycetota bacterium]
MSVQRALSAILAGGLVLTWSVIASAQVDGRRIEEVVKKSVLTQEDFEIIDAFVMDAVGRLVRTTDFTEVAKTRAVILSRQIPQPQYAQRFSDATHREIGKGFEYATNEISDPDRRFRVFTNLLILASELSDLRLVDIGLGMIPHENTTVRYWSVRVATNPRIWDKAGQDQAPLAAKILEACTQVAETSSPETLYLMAQFAGRSDTVPAQNLLVRLADVRIKQYAGWTVKYELADTGILKLLAAKIVSGGTGGQQMAKQFAQLYSYAFQRYIRGVREGGFKDLSGGRLASVLIEGEQQCLSKMLGGPQTAVTRAVEAGDANALQAEHDRLLGGPNQAGALPARFNFTYGSGSEQRPTPLPLPEPPGRPAAETQPPAKP